jgi:hypothetical protein
MGALVDSRRTRTAAGALLELSAMANEKLLLHKELHRWKSRHVEIRRRLAEIAANERRLMALVQAAEPDGSMAQAPASAANGEAGSIGVTAAAPTPAPIEAPPGQPVKIKEFSY